MMRLETRRLLLRPLEDGDLDDLKEILQDPIAMVAYEHAFSDEECVDWLERMKTRMARDGVSLCAVLRKADGAFLGQCGISMQEVEGQTLPEVGYLFKRRYWHNGYATEAAKACLDYGFGVLGYGRMYSIIKHDNLPSQAVAERNGLTPVRRFVKHYHGKDMMHILYEIVKP